MADESLEILRQMLQAERARNDALEEELDLLALDNERNTLSLFLFLACALSLVISLPRIPNTF